MTGHEGYRQRPRERPSDADAGGDTGNAAGAVSAPLCRLRESCRGLFPDALGRLARMRGWFGALWHRDNFGAPSFMDADSP
jgi:hypothetical protein